MADIVRLPVDNTEDKSELISSQFYNVEGDIKFTKSHNTITITITDREDKSKTINIPSNIFKDISSVINY